MTDKLELKSSHEVVYTVDVADVESIFYCKPTDPDILTVLMNNGKRLYCDEVCPVQEDPVSEELEEASKNHATERYRTTRDRELAEKCKWSFKAGAEWGKNQAMAEIQAQSMALAHGCPKEKTSEDLKNAADNALESISDQYDIISVGSCLKMFRLGAEWQKSKMEE